jgi:methyl-accepting chemotaxis protein
MQFFRNLSIKQKMIALIMTTTMVTLCLSSVGLIIYDFLVYKDTMVKNLSSLADIVGMNNTAALSFQDKKSAELTLSALSAEPHIAAARIVTNDGKLFAEYRNQIHTERLLQKNPAFPDEKREGHTLSPTHVSVCRQISLDGETIGYVTVLSSLQPLYTRLGWHAGVILLFLLLSSGVSYVLASRFQGVITEPILELSKKMKTVSQENDYTIRIEEEGHDEIGVLNKGFNTMAVNLRDMLLKIKGLSVNVSAVAVSVLESPESVLKAVDLQKQAVEENARNIKEINTSISTLAHSSDILRESADGASSSVEEIVASVAQVSENAMLFFETSHSTASTIEQMVTSIKETANSIQILSDSSEEITSALKRVNETVRQAGENAGESVKLAERVSLNASDKGLTAVGLAMQGMDEIKESVRDISDTINHLMKKSYEIGTITTVIDDVAHQTSLLSLNAAILAAQAGEHGRTFSVVADEMRMLAERSAASTREIANLIAVIQDEIRLSFEKSDKGIRAADKGVALIHEVNDALQGIFESSRISTEMARSIQNATDKGSNAVQLITHAIERMAGQITHISTSTNEQSLGTTYLLEAVDKIKTGSEFLKKTTEEQFKGMQQLSALSEDVSREAGQIASAINNQKLKSNEILNFAGKIRKTSNDLNTSAQQMEERIHSLNRDAEILLTEIQKFKI